MHLVPIPRDGNVSLSGIVFAEVVMSIVAATVEMYERSDGAGLFDEGARASMERHAAGARVRASPRRGCALAGAGTRGGKLPGYREPGASPMETRWTRRVTPVLLW